MSHQYKYNLMHYRRQLPQFDKRGHRLTDRRLCNILGISVSTFYHHLNIKLGGKERIDCELLRRYHAMFTLLLPEPVRWEDMFNTSVHLNLNTNDTAENTL